ncbi:unnamed protein product [Trichobilharzia regenti]|nr:unnamed protein product [Trichobilharzia regenti]
MIISQKPEDVSKPLCFFFHTKFFPEDVEQELIQATTRRLFYLSVKATILNRSESNMNGNCFGDLCPSLDVAILLASLASQAEYGDVCEDELSDTEELTSLPRRIIRLIPAQLWTQVQSTQGVTQKFKEYYKSHKGMNRQSMNKCQTNAWLGVTASGLQLYGKCQRDPPQFTFPWNLIKNVSYRERKFTIKLTSTWRGTSKPNHSVPTTTTSLPAGLNETSGQTANSSRVIQPSRSPLISVTGQALVGLTVGSSAGGSGTSAASLPSTPISARLVPSIPPISPNVLDHSINVLFPRADTKFDSCDPVQQFGVSKSLKSRAKVFELGSRCIPGLSAKSRYSANELTVTGTSVNCLRTPQGQPVENNITAPFSSKTVVNSSQLNSTTVLISVVEVWLADPNQAKTVMSMCAGNHSLFMRRRQPDSIEVQQMRAQAREERARRDVERARLAKARAEKAEALEAKTALEVRCAQLEEALRYHQRVQKPHSSENRNIPRKSHLNDMYDADSPHSYTSQRPLNEYNCKVAFSSTNKVNQEDIRNVGIPICQTIDNKDDDDEDDDQKSISNVVEDGDKNTGDTGNHVRSDGYFDEYSFYPSVKIPEVNPTEHGKLWDGAQIDQNKVNCVDPAYPNIPLGSFICPYSPDQRLFAGSASVPVTPHAKRSGITVSRRTNHFCHLPLRPSESTGFSACPNGSHFVAANHSNQKVFPYPPYLPTNTGSVCPHGCPCEVSIKPLWSGDPYLACEVPVRSVDQSVFGERHGSYAPFVSAPGSLPALHNDSIHPYSGIEPNEALHFNHNPWIYAARSNRHPHSAVCHMCSPTQSCLVEVPYAAPTKNLPKHSTYSVLKCQVPYTTHDPIDSMQYVYPSSSLAAILSPIVTQRRQHPQRQALQGSQPNRGLRRQQSQPKNVRLPDLMHIPLMERSTSHVQLSHLPSNYGLASPLETCLSNNHPISRQANRGFSLQYIPCSTSVHPGHYDLNPGFEYSNDVHPNPPSHYHRYASTASEHFRRAASVGVSTWNVDPLWTTAPSHERLSRTDRCNEFNIYTHESNPTNSQRNFLTNQLQAEREHFAVLQTQFSRQLCDTWAYLKATRGLQVDKFCDFGMYMVGNSNYNNPPIYGCELRHDPAGASDGASTGGGNLNQCASSERINDCGDPGTNDLRSPSGNEMYEGKLEISELTFLLLLMLVIITSLVVQSVFCFSLSVCLLST